MIATSDYEQLMVKACGHRQNERLRYSGTRQLANLKANLSQQLCGECEATARGWLKQPHEVADPSHLPSLKGSEGQRAWAIKERLKRWSQLGGLMLALAEKQDALSQCGAKALYMMFQIKEARFWIDGRQTPFDEQMMVNEARYIMRHPLPNETLSPASPFAYVKKTDPFGISGIRSSDIAALIETYMAEPA